MATSTQCDKHLFEEANGMCRTCRRPFCADCLVYAHGPNKAPFCIPCALTAAGVSRSILPLLAEEASQQWTGRFNPRPVGEAELLEIYEASL